MAWFMVSQREMRGWSFVSLTCWCVGVLAFNDALLSALWRALLGAAQVAQCPSSLATLAAGLPFQQGIIGPLPRVGYLCMCVWGGGVLGQRVVNASLVDRYNPRKLIRRRLFHGTPAANGQ
jgi:hypothetical protein